MGKVHQFNPDMLPDDDFTPGTLEHLVPGNVGRLMDVRRTPGKLLELDEENAMFKWHITAFEDEGKQWDLPAEDIVRFQFERGAQKLGEARVNAISSRIQIFQETLSITGNRAATEGNLEVQQESASDWLDRRSTFFATDSALDLASRFGPPELAEDLNRYMLDHQLLDWELRTAENIVLNPHSGEWIKGMVIVLAEMGLVDYQGKITRTKDVFAGMGERSHRIRYLLHRLGFVRAFLSKLGFREVVLYRGVSSEKDWKPQLRSLWSYTFNLKVARSFADFDRSSHIKHTELIKRTVPVDRLFMTYLETAAMNRQYPEAEAMVMEFHS
jgi:hypothetical protein